MFHLDYPLTAINHDGAILTIEDSYHLCALTDLHPIIGQPYILSVYKSEGWVRVKGWIVKDFYGKTLTQSQIDAEIVRYSNRGAPASKSKKCQFRSGPVPSSGRRVWRISNIMRAPSYANSLRFYCGMELERRYGDEMIPRSGNFEHRTSWDDIIRQTQRSWKKHRKTQWKQMHG